MNPSIRSDSFTTYQDASKLQREALEAMKRLELLADHGIAKAEKLLDAAWVRYNRRTYRVNLTADLHWGRV